MDGGNLGAPPNPACAGANVAARRRTASARSSASGGGAAEVAAGFRSASARVMRAAASWASPLRSVQVDEIAASSWGKEGMPCRGVGGK